MYRAPIIAAAIGAALPQATQANASIVVFTGSMSGTSTSAPTPSCAPLLSLSTLTGTGTSSLGAFSYTHHVCLSGVGPLNGVDFLLDFGSGNTVLGNMAGVATASGTPLVSNITLDYNILGGSGLYSGASGSFRGLGTVDQRNGPPALVSFNFAPVPEPATWAMMLLGFAGIGLTVRRRAAPALRPA